MVLSACEKATLTHIQDSDYFFFGCTNVVGNKVILVNLRYSKDMPSLTEKVEETNEDFSSGSTLG